MYPTKKLSEIAKTTSGGTPSRDKKEFWGGVIPWLKSGELSDNLNISQSEEFITEEGLNNSSTKIFKKGTLLIAMYGATAGKLGILGFDATTNQAVCSIQNIYNQFIEKYIYYFLFSIRERIIKDSFGGAQPNISKGYLDKLEIPLPPLSIQSRIVVKLDEAFRNIDKQIELLKGNIEDVENMKKSVLEESFQSENYEVKKIGEIFDVRDGTHDSPKFHEKGFPLVTSKNLGNTGIDIQNVRLISQEDYDKINQRSRVNKGDLLFAMIGTIGNPTIVDFEPEFAIKNVALFKPKGEETSMQFLRYFLSSQVVIEKMILEAKGATQKFVGLGYLRQFPIPLPPLPRQHKIIAYLDAVFDMTRILRSEYASQIRDLETLKQSLLEEAFAGRLVV